jgi:magnesium transporter
MFTVSAWRDGTCFRDIVESELSTWAADTSALLWVDVEGPQPEDLNTLGSTFGFHPLALEDAAHRHQRAKLDLYDGSAFAVFYGVHTGSDGRPSLDEVAVFLTATTLVTVREAPNDSLRAARARWESAAGTAHRAGVGGILYEVVDTLLDDFFPVLDVLSDRIDDLEDQIFDGFQAEHLRIALGLRRDLLTLRRVAGPQRDVVNELLRGGTPGIEPAAMPYLQDLYDHALRIVEAQELQRDLIASAMEGILSVQNNQINVVMQRLTVINLLLLPLAVLTGFFGMNFETLPFDSDAAFWVAVAGMVVLPAGLFVWLRARGWG